jgi:hypothetical protein
LFFDFGRIDIGAEGRIFSRHTGIRWRKANANAATLRRKRAARFYLKKQGDDPKGIGSVLIDFDHQFIFLLMPQANVSAFAPHRIFLGKSLVVPASSQTYSCVARDSAGT